MTAIWLDDRFTQKTKNALNNKVSSGKKILIWKGKNIGSNQGLTSKLSDTITLDNVGWPDSYNPVLICNSDSKSFTVNQIIKGSSLVKVVFSTKNSNIAIVRFGFAVNVNN